MDIKKILLTFFQWIGIITIPFFILITVSRLLMTSAFLQIEYRMPWFPEDSYGFSREDRLEFAPYVVDYLINDEGIDYLGDLEFEDGSELFNERELSHMVDVKEVVELGKNIWFGLMIFIGLVGIFSDRMGRFDWFKVVLSNGGMLTVILLIMVAILGLLSFDTLFTNFHRIFFEEGTWRFFYSDTLIRLFPIRFWQDIVIYEILLSTLAGCGLWFGFRKKVAKDE